MKPHVVGLALALMPAVAVAQDPVSGWVGLDTSALSVVHVLDDAGADTKGKLLRIDPDAIVLLVDGKERRFEAARVRRVLKRGDSLTNGVVGGAVVGAVLGILGGALVDCSKANGEYGTCGIPTRIGMAVTSTAFYTAIGVGLDALVEGRTVLYEAPLAPPRGERVGIGFRLTW